MINFLRSKYTIILEILVLLLSILWYTKTLEIEPIITFIGSLSLLIASIGNLKKKHSDNLIEKKPKTLRANFFDDYVPGEIGISKIIEDFGQPQNKTIESVEVDYMESGEIKFNVYKYIFSNAVVLFSTDTALENIIAITLLPIEIKNQPINCRYVFSENEEEFSEADFKKSILKYKVSFENNMFTNWSYSAITAQYTDYKPIKHLFFTYINYNFYEDAEDLYLEKIESLCISTSSTIHPIIADN